VPGGISVLASSRSVSRLPAAMTFVRFNMVDLPCKPDRHRSFRTLGRVPGFPACRRDHRGESAQLRRLQREPVARRPTDSRNHRHLGGRSQKIQEGVERYASALFVGEADNQ